MPSLIDELAQGFRTVQEIKKEMSEAEIQKRVLELQRLLMDAERALHNKDKEIFELRRQAERKVASEIRDGFRYAIADDGQLDRLPFCPSCEADGKLVPIVQFGSYAISVGCPKCRAPYSPRIVLVDGNRMPRG